MKNERCVWTRSDSGWHEEGRAHLPDRRSKYFDVVRGLQQEKFDLDQGSRYLKRYIVVEDCSLHDELGFQRWYNGIKSPICVGL